MFGSPQRRHPRAMSLTSGSRLEAFGSARACAHPDCTTQLSRYNPAEVCGAHGGWLDEQPKRRMATT